MRLMQVKDGQGRRRVVATDRGKSWFVAALQDGLRPRARGHQEPGRRSPSSLRRRAPRAGGRSGEAARRRPRARADRPSRPGASARHRHRPDPSRLGRHPRRHAPEGRPGVAEETLTDSMKMFRMGLEGGKPKRGQGRRPAGVVLQGRRLLRRRRRGGRWSRPPSPLDGGEEPEVAGIYLVGQGRHALPRRLRAPQRVLRPCHRARRTTSGSPIPSCGLARFGPELLLGELPDDVRGTSRIRRGKNVIFEQPFLTGEANMSHTIANLEAHHFKYGYVPPSGRRAYPHLRHGDAVLRRRHQDRGRRRLRDRGARLRPAAGQSAGRSARTKRIAVTALLSAPARHSRQGCDAMDELHRNYIAGEWVDGEAVANINPSNTNDSGRSLCRAPRPTTPKTAIAAAKAAFPAWSRSGIQQRHDILKTASDEILARREELGRLLVARGGQDARRRHRRDGACRADLRLLRRRMPAAHRRDRARASGPAST